MKKPNRVLILSSSYGEGHTQASIAIQSAFQTIAPDTQIRIDDFMEMTHPVLNSLTRYCYFQSIRYAPKLYGAFYKSTRSIKPDSLFQKQLNQLGSRTLKDFLQDYQPDIVIATFPTPAGVVSGLKERGVTNVPLVTVITDHAVHSQWLHSQTDLYLVGSDYVQKGMIQRGIAEDKIAVTGIPIRPNFNQTIETQEARKRLGLRQELPTLLIMGGAYGIMGDIGSLCEELFQFPKPLQIVVICGKNEKLKQQLESSLQTKQPIGKNAIHIHGFVETIHDFMAAADLILTKPGGLTVTECLAMELPMLLYRPIPGQEQQNADFLIQSNVAVLANTKMEAIDSVNTLLFRKRIVLKKMGDHTKQLKHTHAAEDIVEQIINRFEKTLKYV
ncbi:1,2-diacylglycerol 3-glucosyltransferase [Fodinisporobacter ferrooxydans]|uniref:1,2-diacylglycerol 3-glucosyltransferase n=1 Tax=Fodinisporobacter ferrooxydans TaxID=2901836 RepID=A0ABY4CUM0_9BACL|nr:1,2-diacylglycerol 3-glucosyltransferase [Alicyclobacillaceae bacterium MYW30-H2]